MRFSDIDRRSGIYRIVNLWSGRFYIGSATDFYERFHSHLHYLNTNRHHNRHLQRAWNKYSASNFKFEIIEFVEDRGKLEEREQFWIDITDATVNGYNIKSIANSSSGVKRSDETRAKMSAWQIGRTLSEETKNKISVKLKGHKRSIESIRKQVKTRRPNSKFKCDSGWKCKCEDCKTIRKEYQANYMRDRRKSNG